MEICLRYYASKTIFESFPTIFILKKTLSMFFKFHAIVDYYISLIIFVFNFIYFLFNKFTYATVHTAKGILKSHFHNSNLGKYVYIVRSMPNTIV